MSVYNYIAPDGAIWVCVACGKSGKDRTRIGDEACFLNAVLCHDDKPELVRSMDHRWRVFSAALGQAGKEAKDG